MRATLAPFAVGAFLLAATPAVAAEPDVEAEDHSFLVGIEVMEEPSAPASGTAAAAASDVDYVYEAACERGEGISSDGFYGCGEQQSCGKDGLLYSVTAVSGGTSTPQGFTCIEPGEAEPQAVLTPGRILEAFRRVPVPSPSIGVNPVGGRTLVNLDTILHTQAAPFTETVQLLGRRVTFDIEPSEFTWRTGQGEGFTTSDPGQPYRASLPMSAYVTHRYLRAGNVQLELETTWTARWRVGDGPWRPVDGTVTTSSAPVPLQVVTARPQLVSYD